jgi:energy-coupling factor transport system permease protein
VISDSRKAMGENETGNIISSIKNGISTFMIMITWALEHGAQTAESMDGRGYNTTRRTSYSKYFFHVSDALVILFYLMFALLVILTSVINGVGFSFYPDMVMKGNIYYRILIYLAFLILCLMPTILEIGDEIKWHRLKLKI